MYYGGKFLLQCHSGSVWRVSWAHPEFGQVLATCSFDRTVAIWEEQSGLMSTSIEAIYYAKSEIVLVLQKKATLTTSSDTDWVSEQPGIHVIHIVSRHCIKPTSTLPMPAFIHSICECHYIP